MSGITSFFAAASNGALNFVWEVSAALINKDNITAINIILSDATVDGTLKSSIVSRNIDPYTTTDKDGVVNGIVKKYTWTGLTNGTAYVACIQIDVLNGTAVTTYSYNMSGYKRPGTVPVKPQISATSSDQAIKIRLLNYQPNTESDGFYRIQQIKYYLSDSTGFISKAPGTIALGDFTSNMSEADLQTALIAYQGEFSLTGLTNDTKYELAIAVQNELGISQISQTVMLVPGKTVTPPTPVAVATLEYNRYNRTAQASDYPDALGATVMFGQATSRENLYRDKVPVLGYNVYRYDVSSNGSTVYPATKTKVGTISSVDVCGNALPGIIGYTYSTAPLNTYYANDSSNRKTYEFGLIDNSVTRGNYYAYTVVGVNAMGEGVESTTSICRIASKAEAPVVSADPSNNTIKLNVTPFTFNGYNMADASNNKNYYVDVSGVSYSTMERDISGNITLSDASFNTIKNGAEDVVKVAIITQNAITGGTQSYVGLPSVLKTMPYGTPSAPTLQVSTVDVNNIPISGGCKLSWGKISDASANGNTGEVAYNIYVNGSLIVSKVKPTEYLLTGLVNGVTYNIQVAAIIYNTEIKKDVLGALSSSVPTRTFSLPDKAINVDLSNNNGLTGLTGYWQAPANYIVDSSNAIYFRYVLTDLSSGSVKLDSSMNVFDGTLQNRTFDSSTVSGGLVPGTLYQLDVYTGCKPTGQQVVYNLVPVTVYRTLYQKQAAPTNLTVTSLDKALRCTWDPSLNNGVELVGYNIKINGGYVSSTPKTTEYFIAIQDASGIALQNNKTYAVSVAAVGRVKTSKISYDDVVGDYSSTVNGTPAVGPAPVEIISATGKNGEITITWKAIAAASGYAIYKDNESVSSPSFTYSADTISYKATSLGSGTKYTFRVVSYVTVAPQGTGASSINIYAVDSDKSVISAYAYPEPSKVRDLAYTIDSNTINLTWTVPAYTGAAGTGTNGPLLYKVLIDASNADSSLNIVTQDGITSTSYSASGLFMNNKQFKATVRAYFVGADGTIYISDIAVIGDIRPNPKPQNISNLVAVAADHKVTLTWKNPTDLDLYPRTYFNIYKSVNGGEFAPYTRISAAGSSAPNTYVDVAGAASKKYAAGTADFTADPAAGSTAITNADLTNGFTYAYKVVCAISSTGAPNPEAVGSNSVIPFGKPRLLSVTYDSYSGNHTIKVNKNGSSINSGLFVGLGSTTNETPIFLLPSPIGDGVGDRDTVNNIAGLSEYSMVVPSVKAYSTAFIGIGNAAGLTTGTWTASSGTIA